MSGRDMRTDAASSAAGLEGTLEIQPRTTPRTELRNREVAPWLPRVTQQVSGENRAQRFEFSAVSHAR
jgi:hypothetical protein